MKKSRKITAIDAYHISKTINAPLAFVYDWCTDYTEDDNEITGSKNQRSILARSEDRVIFITKYTGRD